MSQGRRVSSLIAIDAENETALVNDPWENLSSLTSTEPEDMLFEIAKDLGKDKEPIAAWALYDYLMKDETFSTLRIIQAEVSYSYPTLYEHEI